MISLLAFCTALVTIVGAWPASKQNEAVQNHFNMSGRTHGLSIPVEKLMDVKLKHGFLSSMREISESTNRTTHVDKKSCPSCECGRARGSDDQQVRITDGHDVKNINQYPWIAQLRYMDILHCGGTLINSRYVLTAAHCIDVSPIDHKSPFEKDLLSIRLLALHVNDRDGNKVIFRKTEWIVKHEDFNMKTIDNDIALIRLNEEVELGNTANKPSPVCLPTNVADKSYVGMDGVVIGWGWTNKNGGSFPSVLQEVRVPIIANEDCRVRYEGVRNITSNMICAAHPNGGKDSCNGDSGGPLMIATNSSVQSYDLVGVVSFGGLNGVADCGSKRYPGVYTKVDRYLKWIYDNVKDACSC